MRGPKVETFQGFIGGVNTADAPYQLAANEARDARNVVSTTRGAIRKRDGAVAFSTPAAQLRSIFAGRVPTKLIGASASVIYAIATDGTVTQLKTGLSNSPWEWVQAPVNGGQGPFWGTNGVDSPQQWDGAAGSTSAWTASAGSIPRGRYLAYAGSRLFVTGVDGDPSAVFASNLRNPRDFDTAVAGGSWVVRLDPEDGEPITGIGVVGPFVLVFKNSKSWVIYDLDKGSNRPLQPGLGCVSHRSIVPTPFGTFFLTKDEGVVSTDGHSVTRHSRKVRATIDAIVAANRSLVAGAYFNDHLYFAISTSGSDNDLLLDYDIVAQAWWPHTLACADLTVWEPGSGPELHAAKAGVAKTLRLFVPNQTQDEGASFTSYYDTPWFTFGTPYKKKRVREIHFDGKGRLQASVARSFSTSFELGTDKTFIESDGNWETNDGGVWETEDGGSWGGAVEIGEAQILTPGVARAWSVRVGNATADPFELESITFAYKERTD